MSQYLKTSNKNKIIVGVFIAFLIVPIVASLSYAEFVEHLWPIQSDLHKNWYAEKTHPADSVPSTPFSNSDMITTPYDDGNVIGIEHVQGMMIFGGILGISILLVYLSNRKEKHSCSISKKHSRSF